MHVHILLTLPPWLTVTLVAQVVWCMGAEGVVGTRVGGAWGEDIGTGGPAIGKLTQTSETGHTIHTGALVQARAGSTLVDVHLAEVTWQKEGQKYTLDHDIMCCQARVSMRQFSYSVVNALCSSLEFHWGEVWEWHSV